MTAAGVPGAGGVSGGASADCEGAAGAAERAAGAPVALEACAGSVAAMDGAGARAASPGPVLPHATSNKAPPHSVATLSTTAS